MGDLQGGGKSAARLGHCFSFPSLNFPFVISSPTPFFWVPVRKAPAPTRDLPGVTVAGRQTLGPRGGLGELGAVMGRAGQGRRDGGSDGEGIDRCGWS